MGVGCRRTISTRIDVLYIGFFLEQFDYLYTFPAPYVVCLEVGSLKVGSLLAEYPDTSQRRRTFLYIHVHMAYQKEARLTVNQ